MSAPETRIGNTSADARARSARAYALAWVRFLTFRLDPDEARALIQRGLLVPLLATWVAGIGRTWDHDWVGPLRRIGVGSLVYVVILGTLLWMFSRPIVWERRWLHRDVVTFVCLTAPPAWLYALPVERWFPISTASKINMALLAVVATWRVALLVWYFHRVGEMRPVQTFLASMTPLCAILFVLVLFDLQYHVGAAMGGMGHAAEMGASYTAMEFVGALGLAGFVLAPVFFLLWLSAAFGGRVPRIDDPPPSA